jgi:hypothetical protein
MHNDIANGSHARLVSTKIGSIGGAHENTSWLIYSCTWTTEENAFVQDRITQIGKDKPGCVSRLLFTQMKGILDQPALTNDSSIESAKPELITEVPDKTKKVAEPRGSPAKSPEDIKEEIIEQPLKLKIRIQGPSMKDKPAPSSTNEIEVNPKNISAEGEMKKRD